MSLQHQIINEYISRARGYLDLDLLKSNSIIQTSSTLVMMHYFCDATNELRGARVFFALIVKYYAR